MRKYMTVQGDMFDNIALEQMGDELYTDRLIKENPQYQDVYIFSAGVELTIPDVDNTAGLNMLPPWKQVVG